VEENNKLHQFGMETKGEIVNNCRKLINVLSKNSFYCRSILFYLMKDLEKYKTLEVFQISERSWKFFDRNQIYSRNKKNKSFTRIIGGNSKNFGRYSPQTK
jgi:hypothetical protein